MEITEVKEKADKICENISRVLIGREKEIRVILAALFAGGHVLVEDRPGTVARHVLAELKIPLKAQDTGLNYGRTVILDCETGDYIIKAVGKEQKVI